MKLKNVVFQRYDNPINDVCGIYMSNEKREIEHLKEVGYDLKGKSLRDFIKDNSDFELLTPTTTMGDYDSDYFNWFGYIDKSSKNETYIILIRNEIIV